jgi:hypothetical protein
MTMAARRSSWAGLIDIECAPWDHCLPPIRDANVLEYLKFVPKCSRLSFHQLNIRYNIFYDPTGYLRLRIAKIWLLDLDCEADCEQKLTLLIWVFPMVCFYMLFFDCFGDQVSLSKVHVLERLIRDELVIDVSLQSWGKGWPIVFAPYLNQDVLIVYLELCQIV